MYWKLIVVLSAVMALSFFSGCSMPTPGDAVMFPVNPIDRDRSASEIQMSPSHSESVTHNTGSWQSTSSFAYPAPNLSSAPGELPDSVDHISG